MFKAISKTALITLIVILTIYYFFPILPVRVSSFTIQVVDEDTGIPVREMLIEVKWTRMMGSLGGRADGTFKKEVYLTNEEGFAHIDEIRTGESLVSIYSGLTISGYHPYYETVLKGKDVDRKKRYAHFDFDGVIPTQFFINNDYEIKAKSYEEIFKDYKCQINNPNPERKYQTRFTCFGEGKNRERELQRAVDHAGEYYQIWSENVSNQHPSLKEVNSKSYLLGIIYDVFDKKLSKEELAEMFRFN